MNSCFLALDRTRPFPHMFSVHIPYGETPMARTIRNAKLDTRSARAKLPARREPYWTAITLAAPLAIGKAPRVARGSRGTITPTPSRSFATTPSERPTTRSTLTAPLPCRSLRRRTGPANGSRARRGRLTGWPPTIPAPTACAMR